jgi:hypothetical protein
LTPRADVAEIFGSRPPNAGEIGWSRLPGAVCARLENEELDDAEHDESGVLSIRPVTGLVG